jgi:hypothetical protein
VRRASLRHIVVLALAAALVAEAAPAQTRERPLLVISMTAGFLTGGKLWTLARQLAPVSSGDMDSLSLGRYFRPGFVVAVGATLFRSPHVGITAEMAYLGLATESRCAPLGPYAFDSQFINEQACNSIQGYRLPTNAATLQAGAVWRALPGAQAQPYLRAVGGAALLGGSFVETRGLVAIPSADTSRPSVISRIFLTQSSRRELTWIATLAAGVLLDVSPGTQLRFEARDVLIRLPVPTGPGAIAAPLPVAPTRDRTMQVPSFTVSVDLILEPLRRPRRY